MCLHPRGGGEKSLLKTEKKIQELQKDLSHNSQWWKSEFLLNS